VPPSKTRQQRTKQTPKPRRSDRGLAIDQSTPDLPGWIAHLNFSPDGSLLAIASQVGSLAIWNLKSRAFQSVVHLDTFHIYATAWLPDGVRVACSGDDRFVYVIDSLTGSVVNKIEVVSFDDAEARRKAWEAAAKRRAQKAQKISKVRITKKLAGRQIRRWTSIHGLDLSPDGDTLATGDDFGVSLRSISSGKLLHFFGEVRQVIKLKWSPDGRRLAATSYDDQVCVFDLTSLGLLYRIENPYTVALAWSPDGALLASAIDADVAVWDAATGRLLHVLQGHKTKIRAVTFSPDGKLIASRASQQTPPDKAKKDNRVILWRTDTWSACGTVEATAEWYLFTGLAFSPIAPILATSANGDTAVRLYTYDIRKLLSRPRVLESVQYKNAKVALVGDSGVGKSGLNLLLTNEPFVPTESTHARKITSLGITNVPLPTGAKEHREVFLWDLAGQVGYRLIHQLHLDDVSVAAIVFDSRSDSDPFAGVRHWNRALVQAARSRLGQVQGACRLLVAARTDRGPIGVSAARLESLMIDLGITDFFETSAKLGTGIKDLRNAIFASVDWSALPAVSSSRLFQGIKRYCDGERRSGRVLVSTQELRRAFIAKKNLPSGDSDSFKLDFNVCIGQLQSLGLLRRFSFGDLLLLQPELLDAYASSILFAAKQEPDGMGSIKEELVRSGEFAMETEDRVQNLASEKLLLLATIEDLLTHELAFREYAEDGAFLVFPSQLTRENPALPDPPGQEAIFVFDGNVANIYATIVVRLAHSGIFTVDEMWRNAATFTGKYGGKFGIYLADTEVGSGKLTVFYADDANPISKAQFEDYVHAQLLRRAVPNSVVRKPVLACPSCATTIGEEVARKRLERGKNWLACSVCETRVELEADRSVSLRKPEESTLLIDRTANRLKVEESNLVSASAEMQTTGFGKWVGANRTTLALVFTDIVGSTALGNKVGDEEMARIRKGHFSRARTLIQSFKGYEIKTIGDAFMIAFRTVVEALDFSMEFQRDAGDEHIRTRVGIHVGPVHVEEGDAFGTMVNYTSRVVNAAKGPEIWVSDRAYQDISAENSDRHAQLIWVRHRNRLLKGFGGRHTLWSIKRNDGHKKNKK